MNKITISNGIARITINGEEKLSTLEHAYLTTKNLIIQEYGWEKSFEFEDTFPLIGDIAKTLKKIGLK